MTTSLRLVLLVSVSLASAFLASGLSARPAGAQADTPPAVPAPVRYVEREFLLPTLTSGRGMDVLEVRVDTPGRHPLAILTHGTSAEPEQRMHVTPWAQLAQAVWFAQRGFVALVVVRDGYGRSGGQQDGREGGCAPGHNFIDAGEASAHQLREAIDYMAKQPEVDASTIVSAGVSTGGFAQVALSADPPPGLKAAISFAGGRGGDGKGNNCNLDGVVAAFRSFGKKSRVPMLWLYAENDKWFPPAMATQFDKVFHDGGGHEEFVMVGPDGEDGHGYFRHVSAWAPRMEEFLKEQTLMPLDKPYPPPPVPNIAAPAGLGERGVTAFETYLAGGPAKAFATNGFSVYGYAIGMFDQDLADKQALDNCNKATHGNGHCTVVSRSAQPGK